MIYMYSVRETPNVKYVRVNDLQYPQCCCCVICWKKCDTQQRIKITSHTISSPVRLFSSISNAEPLLNGHVMSNLSNNYGAKLYVSSKSMRPAILAKKASGTRSNSVSKVIPKAKIAIVSSLWMNGPTQFFKKKCGFRSGTPAWRKAETTYCVSGRLSPTRCSWAFRAMVILCSLPFDMLYRPYIYIAFQVLNMLYRNVYG